MFSVTMHCLLLHCSLAHNARHPRLPVTTVCVQLQANELLLLGVHVSEQLQEAATANSLLSAVQLLTMIDWVAMHHKELPQTVCVDAARAAQLDILAG